MTRYRFEVAERADDEGLRRILAATPMPGRIAVSFRREPSYFDAAVVHGAFHQALVCRTTENGELVACGSRSVRQMYVNGRPRPIGYLSMLRLLVAHRHGGTLARAYAFLHDLHADGRTELYLTTIAEGNDRATSVLTSGRAGLPQYHFAGRYYTVSIPIPRRHGTPPPPGNPRIHVRPATHADLDTLLEFLGRAGPARQFFPRYEAQDFFRPRGTFRDLKPSDLLLAFDGGRLVGTLGAWDQQGFRQTVVERYGMLLRWARPLYNCWASLRMRPRLPEPGRPFRCLTGALPLVAANDRDVFGLLLDVLLVRSNMTGCDYLLVGLHETDPLLPVATRRAAASYVTRLYHACWEDGESLRVGLDGRPCYLELGCL